MGTSQQLEYFRADVFNAGKAADSRMERYGIAKLKYRIG